MKIQWMIVIILIVALQVSIACSFLPARLTAFLTGTPTSRNTLSPTNTRYPTITPTKTRMPYTAGAYWGLDPEIHIMYDDKGQITELYLNIENENCSYYSDQLKVEVNPDGSFTYQAEGIEVSDRMSKEIEISGKFNGESIQGSYDLKHCEWYEYGGNPPYNGSFNASWILTPMPPPTIAPAPTAIPPINGGFRGSDPNVSFLISNNREISNFTISIPINDPLRGPVTCDIRQEGVWTLDEYGHFTARGEGSTTISGNVVWDSASGEYNVNQCGSFSSPVYITGYWFALRPGMEASPTPPGTPAPAQLIVKHNPNPVKYVVSTKGGSTHYVCNYQTSVTAINSGVTIQAFEMYYWEGDEWITSDSDSFTASDFEEWYSCSNSFIASGKTCSDPQNWNSIITLMATRNKWVYKGVDVNGNEVEGEAIIQCLP